MTSSSNGGKTALIVGFGILGFLLLIVLVFFANYVSAYNYGNRTENQLDSQYQNSQNVFANYTTKVAEIAQVPAMYRDDLEKIITSALRARYGQEGSKATWQFLQEQNPNLDSKLYGRIADVIEAGRDEFKTSQTLLIDTRRSYKTQLGNFWSGFMLKLAGYPKVDLNKYDPVINAQTEQAFKTKRDEGVKLR